MIFYGMRSTPVSTELLAGAKCSQCAKNTINGYQVYRYIHLYWIPLIPTGSTKITVCNECSHQEVLDEQKYGFQSPTTIPSRPGWHWIGPNLVVSLFISIAVSGENVRSSKVAR